MDEPLPANIACIARVRRRGQRHLRSRSGSLNVLNAENLGGPNMRTFEIPASGGVMLARYSPEQDEFFPEGEAALYYRSPAEIDDKIDRSCAIPTCERACAATRVRRPLSRPTMCAPQPCCASAVWRLPILVRRNKRDGLSAGHAHRLRQRPEPLVAQATSGRQVPQDAPRRRHLSRTSGAWR